ncbi:MAG: MFS transporter [Hyphomicrobiales bacterium]|nr:MAG: MFS transporter [Hyphomicrobiales bacterium]
MSSTGTGAAERQQIQRRVRSAVIIGSALEWFDFMLFASMSALIFNKIFFTSLDPASATLASLATFGVGFLARPFGGIILGALGDRIGRKKVLMITFVLMGVSSGLIGLVPSYQSIGILAPILLVVLRLAQGFGAGAETASAIAVAFEFADKDKQGRQASWPAIGSNLGLFLASIVVALLATTSDEFLLGIGWRIPFVASFALVGLGMIVRSRMPETPEFEQATANRVIVKEKSPLLSLIKGHWPALLVTMIVYFGYNGSGYLFKTFSLAYLTTFRDTDRSVGALAVAVATGIAVLVVPIAGRLTDLWGTWKVLFAGGVFVGAFAFPFFWLLDSGNPVLICIAIVAGTGIVAPTMLAAQGSYFARLFPVEVRNSGMSTGREVGGAIAGALAPVTAMALVQSSSTNSTWGVSGLFLLASLCIAGTVLIQVRKSQARYVGQIDTKSTNARQQGNGPSAEASANTAPSSTSNSRSEMHVSES